MIKAAGQTSLHDKGQPIQITVISGKGGTGKTSIAGCFAALSAPSGDAVFADCDVDAANLALILRPTLKETHGFTASKKARIDPQRCTGCGECARACRSEAITGRDGSFAVDHLLCEGCGICSHVCPTGAVAMEDATSGRWFISDTPYGPLVHARLSPGEENSGKLVTVVRNKAKEIAESQGRNILIIDGPPGIGCPVIASLAGVSCALVVAEPTLSGIHDMERVLEVCRHFGVPATVCINRFDLHEQSSRDIEEFCDRNGIEVVGRIPFDRAVTEAMVRGLPVVECSDGEASKKIRRIWGRVLEIASGAGQPTAAR